MRGRFGPLTEGDERGRIVRNVAGQTESAPQGAFTCPLGTDLGENDYIVDVATGRSWKILGETTPPSATAVLRRLLIRED